MSLRFALARTISSGLGTGFSPKVSGTVASAVALFFWWLFLADASSAAATWTAATALMLLGVIATHIVISDPSWRTRSLVKESHKGHLDPREVVVDEWVGMWAALIPATAAPFDMLVAFCLFRAFDILKPGPIRRAERLPGAWGIMLDDLLAGVASALLLWGLKTVLP